MPAGHLLDTSFVSEVRKRRPDPGVIAFLSENDPTRSFVSTLTLGELRKGVAALHARNHATTSVLAKWIDQLEAEFSDRIISVDLRIARIWGELSARRSLPVVDALLAATALAHDLTLVTRNVRDFAATGAEIINPWRAGS